MSGRADVFATLLSTPALRANLRSVTIDSGPVWEAVTSGPLPRLSRVRCWSWKRGDIDARMSSDVLPWVERTKSITAIGIRSCDVEHLSEALAKRLTELEIDGSPAELAAEWRKWPRLRMLASLWGDRLELHRDGKTELARYRPSTFFKGDGKELRSLPKEIRRLEIVGNAAFFKRAEPVLGKRFDLVFRPLPSGLIANSKA